MLCDDRCLPIEEGCLVRFVYDGALRTAIVKTINESLGSMFVVTCDALPGRLHCLTRERVRVLTCSGEQPS